MLRGLYTSASGMLVESMRADLVANNLANVDTVGFKRQVAAVAAFPEMLLQRVEAGRSTPIGRLGTGAAIDAEVPDFTPGPLQQTGRSLDVALVGGGFFAVETGDGEFALTRDGRFHISADGWLVDIAGRRVLGEDGPLQLGEGVSETDIVISDDGTVHVAGEPVGRIARYTVANPLALERLGGGLWRFNEASGEPEPTDAPVRSGMLERSNVNVVLEMVQMIEVTRAYEASQRVIQAYDEILQKTVNELGALG